MSSFSKVVFRTLMPYLFQMNGNGSELLSVPNIVVLFGYTFFSPLQIALSLILNSVPTPTSLSTSTEPPIFSIILLHIERPSPVPVLFLLELSYSFPKSMNI